jgi:hypothetical protein
MTPLYQVSWAELTLVRYLQISTFWLIFPLSSPRVFKYYIFSSWPMSYFVSADLRYSSIIDTAVHGTVPVHRCQWHPSLRYNGIIDTAAKYTLSNILEFEVIFAYAFLTHVRIQVSNSELLASWSVFLRAGTVCKLKSSGTWLHLDARHSPAAAPPLCPLWRSRRPAHASLPRHGCQTYPAQNRVKLKLTLILQQ